MRKWYKYWRDDSVRGRVLLPIDAGFEAHAQSMGGYGIPEACRTQEEYFRRYYFGYHWGRLEVYDRFLRKHLRKADRAFSVASGRSANELFLSRDGFDIVCSDLDTLPSHGEILSLFPGYRFRRHDILAGPTPEAYDAVLCLSLIYLFDEEQLSVFFRNVSDSLREGGKLLLDSAGAPDTLSARLLHDGLLRFEAEAMRCLVFPLKGRLPGFVTKHFGYRRTDREIRAAAERHGLRPVDQEDSGQSFEFRRSILFGSLLRLAPVLEPLFRRLGRGMPYVRMFCFVKGGAAAA